MFDRQHVPETIAVSRKPINFIQVSANSGSFCSKRNTAVCMPTRDGHSLFVVVIVPAGSFDVDVVAPLGQGFHFSVWLSCLFFEFSRAGQQH